MFTLSPRVRRRCAVASAALALCLTTLAHAAWPERPLRLIVPYPPGGSGDTMARGLATELAQQLGQQVVVENRGGAGGAIAAEAVARLPGDGYSLLFGTMTTHTVLPTLNPKLGYDAERDFTPIGMTHETTRVLVVHNSVPATSVAELIALAKAKPGELTYGSSGNGSSAHLAGVLFEQQADVDMLHVPYQGSAQMLTDLLAGRIQLTFDSYAVYEEHIRNGTVRALGVTSPQRLGVLPDVPTIAEAGLPDYVVANWFGLFAPAGVAPEIVQRLNAAMVQAMETPSVREPLLRIGIVPMHSSPEELKAAIARDLPRWAEVINSATAQLD